uniref:Uncharacterized protein n=1 Tax=Oryza glaberrima TaxID=4538 RepID=A0A679BDC6_ORYGL|nr:hypothetical protein [Oryza glaberrima]
MQQISRTTLAGAEEDSPCVAPLKSESGGAMQARVPCPVGVNGGRGGWRKMEQPSGRRKQFSEYLKKN